MRLGGRRDGQRCKARMMLESYKADETQILNTLGFVGVSEFGGFGRFELFFVAERTFDWHSFLGYVEVWLVYAR